MHATIAARGSTPVGRPGPRLPQPWAPCAASQRPNKRPSLHVAVLSGRLQQEEAAAVAAALAPLPAALATADSSAAKDTAGSSASGSCVSTGSSGSSHVHTGCPPADPPADSPPPLAAQRGTQPASSAAAAAQQHAQHLGVPPPAQLPRHLAVIMDGNSRWAQQRGLPAAVGYQRGVEALRCVVRCCHEWGISCLTVSPQCRHALPWP